MRNGVLWGFRLPAAETPTKSQAPSTGRAPRPVTHRCDERSGEVAADGKTADMTTLRLSTIDLNHDYVLMTHELLASGYDDRAITRMVRDGRLHRLRHGTYTPGDHWRGLEPVGRRRLVAHATLRCARSPAILAGPSAADALGVPVWDMGEHTHLARLDERANRLKTAKVQHRASMRVEDVTIRNGVPMTSGTRTALDMTVLADIPHALVTVNGLLHAEETTADLLRRRAEGLDHDPHSVNMRAVLALAEPRCESAGESRSWHLFWAQGLPMPVPQFEVRDATGRLIGRVDFAWPEQRASWSSTAR